MRKLRVFEIVISLCTTICLALGGWQCLTLVKHGETLAGHTNQLNINTANIAELRAAGSPGLQSHERMDQQRIDELRERTAKLENMMIQMTTQFGQSQREFGIIATKLEGLSDGIKTLQKP